MERLRPARSSAHLLPGALSPSGVQPGCRGACWLVKVAVGPLAPQHCGVVFNKCLDTLLRFPSTCN